MSKISVFDIDTQKKRLKKIAYSKIYNKKYKKKYYSESKSIRKVISEKTGYIRYELKYKKKDLSIYKIFKLLDEAIKYRDKHIKKEKKDYIRTEINVEKNIQKILNSNGTYSFKAKMSINGKTTYKTTQTLEKAREIRDNLLAKQKLAKKIKQLQRK